jgi:NlpC/P60 family putative phage cell wall peptidase
MTPVEIARDWIGTPYHHQESVKAAGTDCLGLIRGVWRELYGAEPEAPPPYTQTWGDYSKRETLLEAAYRNLELVAMAENKRFVVRPRDKHWEPGAVLVFRRTPGAVAKHCAILSGDESMVHAYSGVGVRETSVGIWDKRVAGIFRFPGH